MQNMKKLIILLLSITLCSIIFTSVNILNKAPEKKDPTAKPKVTVTPKPVEKAPPVKLEVAALQYPFPAKGIPILMYHSISYIPKNKLGLPPQKFAAQMQYLHDTGFNSISFKQLYAAYCGKAVLPKKPIILTFDDGYRDNYSAAFPILKQYHFTATIFVITDLIGKHYLTTAQLKEMQAYGIDIESHTVSHDDLRTLSAAQQRTELANSKAVLENKLGKKVEFFCYPAGKYNKTTLRILRELGYKGAVTTRYGKVHLYDNLYKLKRIRVNGNISLKGFKEELSTE